MLRNSDRTAHIVGRARGRSNAEAVHTKQAPHTVVVHDETAARVTSTGRSGRITAANDEGRRCNRGAFSAAERIEVGPLQDRCLHIACHATESVHDALTIFEGVGVVQGQRNWGDEGRLHVGRGQVIDGDIETRVYAVAGMEEDIGRSECTLDAVGTNDIAEPGGTGHSVGITMASGEYTVQTEQRAAAAGCAGDSAT
jgi:hypothetical protein